MSDIIHLRRKLQHIQSSLKAPKGQKNKFGNYSYRSAEDILEAVKPLLALNDTTLICHDRIEVYGEQLFNVTTVTLLDCDDDLSISTEHAAMHSIAKKGMDSAQISGSTASYSLKRALGNLFAIDNEKDADATNKHDVTVEPKSVPGRYYIDLMKETKTIEELAEFWESIPIGDRSKQIVINAKDKQKQKLQ
tara:strand:- start:7064 stop:7639 length:576 start_codon:yes stop_codon:yes gene_type:complete